jgi:hypothetical protein
MRTIGSNVNNEDLERLIEKKVAFAIEMHMCSQHKSAFRFRSPSAQDVTDYAASIGFVLDGQRFVDFYTAKGWRVGNSLMKDWRAAVRTWKGRESQPTPLLDTPEQIEARLKAKGLID